MSKRYQIPVAQAESLAKELAKRLRGGEVLALTGPLGSGKTTFTQYLEKALGVKNNIASPTFIIMQEYRTAKKTDENLPLFMYHLDLYRTHSPADVVALGLDQIWNQPNTVTIIEWANKIKELLPAKTVFINFEHNENQPD